MQPRYYEADVTLEDGSDAKQMVNEQENLVKVSHPPPTRALFLTALAGVDAVWAMCVLLSRVCSSWRLVRRVRRACV
jgi:hypothetical protein